MPTIQEAILLLGPSVYWPLNTGDESGATDLGLGTKPASLSGDLNLEQVGPEDGTRAVRLFAGGALTSAAMALTAFGDFTLSAFVSAPANGLPNPAAPWLVLGDPANRLAHGYRLEQTSSAVNNLSFIGRGSSQQTLLNAVAPLQGWHHTTFTYTTTGGERKLLIDGTISTATTGVPGLLPVGTDPLQIKSDYPLVVSHMAWWPRALSQAEVKSISDLRVPWPFDLPINTPQTTTGDTSGDLESIEAQLAALTGTQTAQSSTLEATKVVVDFIKTQWDGYQAVSLPSLGALLDGIKLDLQTTTEGAAGLISQSVGALLGFRLPSPLDAFDISGGSTGDQVDADISRNFLYGLQLVIDAYPEDWKWRTPDHAWSLKDLATIRFFRGSDLVGRFGVHTTSFNVEPIPGALAIVGGGITTVYWMPPDSHVVVDFYPGVSGTLWEQRWP